MDIAEIYKLYKAHPCITTDSRHCPKGSIFLALKGASFDGNRFADKALAAGCSFAIVDDSRYAQSERCILVSNCLDTYKQLARLHRREFNIPVIGITGTNGKTTTKELVSAVLAQRYRVHHTEKNFNNDVGVPRTLLGIGEEHQMAVVEMGASHVGDIKKLVEYVEPTCGLITNVGRAHLQGFGSFEGVIRTKGELYDYLRQHNGFAFLNNDNPYLNNIVGTLPTIRYGSPTNEAELLCEGQAIESASPYLSIRFRRKGGQWRNVCTRLIGAYNTENILAAITIGLHFGVDEEKICAAISNYEPTNDRSELKKTESNTLIIDAYNANPTSMNAALQNFAAIKAEHKMAILGDMRELGEASHEEHLRIARLAAEQAFDETWLVGPEFAAAAQPGQKCFGNTDDVTAYLGTHKPKGELILIKGSNSTQLYRLPEYL